MQDKAPMLSPAGRGAANKAVCGQEEDQTARWLPIATAPTDRPVVVRQRTDSLQGGWFVATVTLPDPEDESRFAGSSTIWHYNGDILMSRFRGMWTHWLCDDPAALASTAGAGAGDWVTVPREVSIPMRIAFNDHHARGAQTCWDAVLAAAPAVPASARSGAAEDSTLLDMIASHGLSVVPQVDGGWFIEADEGSGEQGAEIVRTRDRLRPALREAARVVDWDLPALPPAPAENRLEIRTLVRLVEELYNAVDAEGADIGGHRRSLTILREIGPALEDAKVALSQGGGAGRSERAVEIREAAEGEEANGLFDDLVVIWSERTSSYWRRSYEGTTKDLRRAAVHRRADAEKIADGAPWLRLIPIAEVAASAPAQSPSTSDTEG